MTRLQPVGALKKKQNKNGYNQICMGIWKVNSIDADQYVSDATSSATQPQDIPET